MTLEVAKAALAIFNPPPALKIWEWAEKRRRLDREVTSKAGNYSVDFAPYQREPQEAFQDSTVQKTVLYMAKRLGKTEMAVNLIGATIEQDPMNILVMKETLDSSRKFSTQFLVQMIDSTPELKALFAKAKSRDSNNTILRKKFIGGTISMVGANVPGALRQVQAPIIFCDEIDGMENSPLGDPVDRAFGRAENYKNSILVAASTASFLETSRIHKLWEGSDQRKWHVKSPCCGNYHVLAWAQVKWPKTKREDGTHEHLTKEAYYECPDCGNHWSDVERLQAIRAGEWRPTAPFKGIRGYWLNGLNSPFDAMKGYVSKLHQFAAEHVEAVRKGDEALLVWENEFLCEPRQIKGEQIDKKSVLERLEDYAPDALPNLVLFLVAGVDIQKDRIEYEVIGVGEGEETWGIEYGKLMGWTEREEVWEALSHALRKTYTRKDGLPLDIAAAAIDHGYKGKYVKLFIKRNNALSLYAVYGAGQAQQSLIITNRKRQLHALNVAKFKDHIFERLGLTEPGPRYMHYPTSYDRVYFDQLTVEEKNPRYKHGQLYFEWTKKPHERNEALDIRVYGHACIELLRPNVPAIKANLELAKNNLGTGGKDYVIKPAEAPQPPRKRMQVRLPVFG